MKMAARAGMWCLVRRMHLGVQAYKDLHEGYISSPSNYSLLARITTKFELQPDMNKVHLSEANDLSDRDERRRKQKKGRGTVKWLVVGGLLIASGLTLRANGARILLQMLCRRRKQLKDQSRGKERTRL